MDLAGGSQGGTGRSACGRVDGFHRNRWTICAGISGRVQPEWVHGLNRAGGRFRPEYAGLSRLNVLPLSLPLQGHTASAYLVSIAWVVPIQDGLREAPMQDLLWGLHLTRLPSRAQWEILAERLTDMNVVVLHANVWAGAGESTSARFAALPGHITRVVDPHSVPFGLGRRFLARSNDPDRLRQAIDRLATEYGEVYRRLAEIEEGPSLRCLGDLVYDLVPGVLSFQRKVLGRLAKAPPRTASGLSPDRKVQTILVPPYFRIPRESHAAWAELNLTLWETASEDLRPGETMLPVLHLSRALLTDEVLAAQVRSCARNQDIWAVALWVVDWDEVGASRNALVGLRRFVEVLSEHDIRTIVYYGGYFTGLLTYSGLGGWFHRLGSDRSSNVRPAGGGGALPPQYYVPQLHRNVGVERVARIIEERWGNDRGLVNLCDCPTCRRAATHGLLRTYGRQNGRKARGERGPQDNHLEHRLAVRARETNAIRSQPWPVLRAQLASAQVDFPSDVARHIGAWLAALPE